MDESFDLELKNRYEQVLRGALLPRLYDPLFVRHFLRTPLVCVQSLQLPPEGCSGELLIFAQTFEGMEIQQQLAQEGLDLVAAHQRQLREQQAQAKVKPQTAVKAAPAASRQQSRSGFARNLIRRT